MTTDRHTKIDLELRIGPPESGLDADALRQRVAEQLFGDDAREIVIGRFEVLQLLGAGGMGVVYLARDPRLDRRVALKLLHPELVESSGRERLEREALALARLSHPNVTQVYEVGEHDGAVFIVMEYVAGESLREWQERGTRSWQEVVGVHLAAGEGLAAAHAAGLVHRDYKPANVLVGLDGRVCVADFGLAIGSGLTPDEMLPSESSFQDGESTSPGAKQGTPAYMSPEQLAGEKADARSDQFSYCVAFWEALFGTRPFKVAQLWALVDEQPTPVVPADMRGVPRWLRKTLERGLSLEPARRWPSMDALLNALRSRARRRHWHFVAVAALAMVGAWAALPSKEDVCAPTADLQPPWDLASKERFVAEVEAHGTDFARDTAPRVAEWMETYARSWEAARRVSCEATLLAGTRSPEQLAYTTSCLERLGHKARRSVEVLSEQGAFEHADDLLAELEMPERCLDTLELFRMPAPRPEVANAVEATREQIEHAHLAVRAGAYGEALTIARSAVASARRTEYGPVLAEAFLVEGLALRALAEYDLSRERLMEAVNHAEVARHDEVAAAAWRHLIDIAVQQEHFDRAREWTARSRAAVDRLSHPATRLADHLDVVGSLELATEHPDTAVKLHREAAAVLEGMLPDDDPRVARNAIHLANALAAGGHVDDALAIYRKTLALRQPRLGDGHPELAILHYDIGYVELGRDNVEAALPHLRAALSIQRAVYGASSSEVARTQAALADAVSEAGQRDEALRLALAAWEVQRHTLPVGHRERTAGLSVAINVLLDDEAHLEVVPLLRLLAEELGDSDLQSRVEAEFNIGVALRLAGKLDEARPQFRWVLEHAEDPVVRLHAAAGLGHAAMALGDYAEARAVLQDAGRVAAEAPAEEIGEVRADIDWDLAQVMVAQGAPPSQWRPLARSALEAYRALDTRPDVVGAIAAFLASR